MYKDEYIQKMNKLLEDKTTYKTIRVDPTQKLQNRNNKIINDLFKQELIDYRQRKNLTCDAAIAPRLYGLTKILPFQCKVCEVNWNELVSFAMENHKKDLQTDTSLICNKKR